jgi:hypothetical protein
MKRNSIFLALFLAAGLGYTPFATSQQSTTTTKTTEKSPDGRTKVTTKTKTVDGTVVSYEQGRTIVVRGSDDREITYTLSPDVSGANDVQVGRRVSLSTLPGQDGATLVSRITTTSVTPEGNLKTENETRATSSTGQTSSSKTTTVTGTVASLEPGSMVTLTLPNNQTAEYTIDAASIIPGDLTVGRTVTITTTRGTTDGQLLVKKITTKTTTKTTKSK